MNLNRWLLVFVVVFLGGMKGVVEETVSAVIVASPKVPASRPIVLSLPPAISPDTSSLAKPFTKITSESMDLDYEKRVSTFEGNVIATDPKLTLKCKTMKVFADRDNKIIRVEAYADVHLYHEGKEGIGDKAVYTKETGLVVLSGIKPMLKDEKGNWMLSRGDGIIYNIHTKDMHVDKPTLEIQPSSEGTLLKPSTPK